MFNFISTGFEFDYFNFNKRKHLKRNGVYEKDDIKLTFCY